MKQRDQRKQPGKPKPLKRKLHINGQEWSYHIVNGAGESWDGSTWEARAHIKDPSHQDLGRHVIPIDREVNTYTHPIGEDSTYWSVKPSDVKSYIETNLVGA